MRPALFASTLLSLVLSGCGSDDGAVAPAQVDAGADTVVAVTDTGVVDTSVAETAGAACADPPAGSVVKVSVGDLKALLDGGAKLAVLDVREPSETSSGVIAGAFLMPWSSGVLKARHTELPTDRPLYVLCQSGTRSALATDFLSKNGHACIHDTTGGMMAWRGASYPTVTP